MTPSSASAIVRNPLEGHGLVFNPGEHVEGYSNFLWVVRPESRLIWTGHQARISGEIRHHFPQASAAMPGWEAGRKA